MQVQRVDSRTLRCRGDPCHSLKAPSGHVVPGAAFSNTCSRSTYKKKTQSYAQAIRRILPPSNSMAAGLWRWQAVSGMGASCMRARQLAARWVPAPGLEGAREGFFVPGVGGFTCLPARYRRLSVGRCSRVASHHYFHVVFPSQGHFARSKSGTSTAGHYAHGSF